MRRLVVTTSLISLLGLYGTAQSLFESAVAGSAAQDDTSRAYELGGYARGVVYGGSKDYDISSAFGEFALTARATRGKAFLFADTRIREGHQFGEPSTDLQLKEAYAGYRSERIDFYLGSQIVQWGRTDGFNPTNNISPNNYFLLSPDPDDQTLGNLMLRSVVRLSNRIDLELIGIPVYLPSVYRYDLFNLGDGVSFDDAERLSPSLSNASVAARLNFEFPSVGFSLSYFHGYNPFYGFGVSELNLQAQEFTYKPFYHQKHSAGADMELPLGQWIARGELALNLTTDYEEQMHIPNPDLSYVAGIERTIGGVTAIMQYVGKYVIDFNPLDEPAITDPTNPMAMLEYGEAMVNYESTLFNRKSFHQQEETNHAVFLTLSRSFAYEVVSAELTGYYNITSEEYMVRPNVTWSATDDLALTLGGSWMWGPDESIFQFTGHVINGAWLGMKYSF